MVTLRPLALPPRFTSVQVWEQLPNARLRPTKVRLQGLTRTVNCAGVASDGVTAVLGTQSGDLLYINMSQARYLKHVPLGLVNGVQSLALMGNGALLVGSGNGTVAYARPTAKGAMQVAQSAKLEGSVTSVAPRGQGHEFFVGTSTADQYHFSLAEFTHEMRLKAHHATVEKVVFPRGISQIYATCTDGAVFVWAVATGKAVMEVARPGCHCTSIDISPKGDSIVSGWDDGYLRFYAPESGKVQFEVRDAHPAGVSTVGFAAGGALLVTGGNDGQVRFWSRGAGHRYKLEKSCKDHKGRVMDLAVRDGRAECVTVGRDGSAVTWDLEELKRVNMVLAQTNFLQVGYARDEAHVIVTGADGNIYYLEGHDGSIIREVEVRRPSSWHTPTPPHPPGKPHICSAPLPRQATHAPSAPPAQLYCPFWRLERPTCRAKPFVACLTPCVTTPATRTPLPRNACSIETHRRCPRR